MLRTHASVLRAFMSIGATRLSATTGSGAFWSRSGLIVRKPWEWGRVTQLQVRVGAGQARRRAQRLG